MFIQESIIYTYSFVLVCTGHFLIKLDNMIEIVNLFRYLSTMYMVIKWLAKTVACIVYPLELTFILIKSVTLNNDALNSEYMPKIYHLRVNIFQI